MRATARLRAIAATTRSATTSSCRPGPTAAIGAAVGLVAGALRELRLLLLVLLLLLLCRSRLPRRGCGRPPVWLPGRRCPCCCRVALRWRRRRGSRRRGSSSSRLLLGRREGRVDGGYDGGPLGGPGGLWLLGLHGIPPWGWGQMRGWAGARCHLARAFGPRRRLARAQVHLKDLWSGVICVR